MTTKTPPAPGRLRRFLSLPAPERRLWLEAWTALLAADFRLRLSARRAVARALVPTERPSAAGPVDPTIARSIASAAAHHLWPMTCLPRSLALRRMLRRRGHAALLRLGVRRAEGTLAAHAWIECNGVAIGEPEAISERFLSLAAPGERSAG